MQSCGPDPEPGWGLEHLADAAATRALGRALASLLLEDQQLQANQRPATLLLRGQLGAGKTSLVQGLAEGLGIDEPITSPSFALAQHYRGSLDGGSGSPRSTALVHLDLYRLEQPAAAAELLAQEEEEAIALGAVLAVEWPERLAMPPAGAWQLQLELADPQEPAVGRIAWLLRPKP